MRFWLYGRSRARGDIGTGFAPTDIRKTSGNVIDGNDPFGCEVVNRLTAYTEPSGQKSYQNRRAESQALPFVSVGFFCRGFGVCCDDSSRAGSIYDYNSRWWKWRPKIADRNNGKRG